MANLRLLPGVVTLTIRLDYTSFGFVRGRECPGDGLDRVLKILNVFLAVKVTSIERTLGSTGDNILYS
jgi:hypothetical protein